MEKVVVFGDSFADETLETSFTKHLRNWFDITNLSLSGTTMGEYSVYPVDGNSLLSRLYGNPVPVQMADIIILEFGINDVSASMVGTASYPDLVVSITKALDIISSLNPAAEVYFLTLTGSAELRQKYAKSQMQYLACDWMRGFFRLSGIEDMSEKWAEVYYYLENYISRRIPVIHMIDDPKFLEEHMSEDNLHPTDTGYSIIANNIEEGIKQWRQEISATHKNAA